MENRLPLEDLLKHAQEDAKAHYQAEPRGLHPAAWGKGPKWAAYFYAIAWYDLKEEEEKTIQCYMDEFLKVYMELQEQDHLAYLERLKHGTSGYFNTLSYDARRRELQTHFRAINAYLSSLNPAKGKPLDHSKLQELDLLLKFLASTNPYPIIQDTNSLPVLMDQMEIYLSEHNGDKMAEDEWNIFFFISHLAKESEALMQSGYMTPGNRPKSKKKELTEAYTKLSDIQLLISHYRKILEED